MFKRFIVATDLSPASFSVVSCLGGLKAYGGEQCLLLQCLSLSDATSTALSYSTEGIEERLKEQQQILEEQGFLVEARTVVGNPKKEIVRIAAKEDYALIVVGSQGHSLVEEKLLGGVAYVEQMVADGAGHVTLVHVQDKTKLEKHRKSQLEEFNKRDRIRLDNMNKGLLKKGDPKIDIEVCCGRPFQEIVRLILERDVQLVVLGTQGRGLVGEVFLGSVSHNVARHSVAPVLLIPARR